MSPLPMRFSLLFFMLVLTGCLSANCVFAQLRAGAAARREARDERWNRNIPPPTPARDLTANSRVPDPHVIQPRAADLRTGALAAPAPANRVSLQTAVLPPGPAAPTGRTPAQATRPSYSGSGVSIRMPNQLQGEVQFLIDNSQRLVVRPGQQQQLRSKPQYEVRFSRGVQDDGQSFGEARYTITEGKYRFDATDKGWELYREADASPIATPKNQAPVIAPSLPSNPGELPLSKPLGANGGSLVLGEPESRPLPEQQRGPESLPAPKSQSILEP